MSSYPIPAHEERAEISVLNSRFIASIAPAFSVEEARAYIARIRSEFSDASHHVSAFLIGFGASVISHCHDDGEPSGSAGRPALAVLSGSGLGDVVVVITRYFGGTKLGIGGLVRAYSDSVREVLQILPRAQRIPTHTIMLALPYSWFERARLLISTHSGQVMDEEFTSDVTISARFSVDQFPKFQDALLEMSHGQLQAEIIETGLTIIPLSTM